MHGNRLHQRIAIGLRPARRQRVIPQARALRRRHERLVSYFSFR